MKANDLHETVRLILRRFREDDWHDIKTMAEDMEATGGSLYDRKWPTSEEDTRGMAKYLSSLEGLMAVWLKEEEKVIGLVSHNGISEEGALDLGHMFHSGYRRDGLDTEALRVAIDMAFENPAVGSVEARNAVEWKGQIEPLKDLGLTETGRGKGSFANDAKGDPIEFVASTMEVNRAEWQPG